MTRRTLSLVILLSATALAPLAANAATPKIPKIMVPKSAATLAMSSVDSGEVHLTNILVNGKSIGQPVAPGSAVQISFTWSLSEPSGCPACDVQGYIGFQAAAATCFGDNASGPNAGSFSGSLTAPNKPGTYPVMVNETLDLQCDAITSGGGGLSSIAGYVTTIKVK